MAIAVIAGLTFATFLTLIVVPVMYSLVDDLGDFFKRHFSGSPAEPADVEEIGPLGEVPDAEVLTA